jgi:hypothetical protein
MAVQGWGVGFGAAQGIDAEPMALRRVVLPVRCLGSGGVHPTAETEEPGRVQTNL